MNTKMNTKTARMARRASVNPPINPWAHWWERGIALLAALNLGLVVFDLTYVPWRNFWLQGTVSVPLTDWTLQLPLLKMACPDPSQSQPNSETKIERQTSLVTCLYDPIKGIEPHRDTQRYWDTLAQLQQQLNTRGLPDPTTRQTLETLRALSTEMIETNPFAEAGKSGTLERIKNRIRQQVFGNRNASAKQAFNQFWSGEYLQSRGWQSELSWFNRQIAPLITSNYFRGIDESGNPTDHFGLLDVPFALLFGIDYLGRSYGLSRQQRWRWSDALLWRWYDGLLFFPFWWLLPGWGWLRVLPVTIRLHQSGIIDLHRAQVVASRSVVANIADDVTEAVVLQLLTQVQGAVQRGDIWRWLKPSPQVNPILANQVDELTGIVALLARVITQQVLPEIRPELQALLKHNLHQILSQAPAYQTLKALPGVGELSGQLSERLAAETIQGLYSALSKVMSDAEAGALTRQLVQEFILSLGDELQQQQVLQELQILLADLIEEAKLGYRQQAPQFLPPSLRGS